MHGETFAKRNQTYWNAWGNILLRKALFGAQPKTFPSGVQVPEKCFKVIVMETNGQPKVLAFIMPQSVAGNEQPARFFTSVNEIEKKTGLDFFSELPKDMQEKLEAEVSKRMW